MRRNEELWEPCPQVIKTQIGNISTYSPISAPKLFRGLRAGNFENMKLNSQIHSSSIEVEKNIEVENIQ